jgi:hypothetical protein
MNSMAMRETAMVMMVAYEFWELDAYVSVAEHSGLPVVRNPWTYPQRPSGTQKLEYALVDA